MKVPGKLTKTEGILLLLGVLFLAALAALCALVSIAFCVSMHKTERLLQRRAPNPYLRVLLGSDAVKFVTAQRRAQLEEAQTQAEFAARSDY